MKVRKSVTCPHCGHSFITESRAMKIYCPECNGRILIRSEREYNELRR